MVQVTSVGPTVVGLWVEGLEVVVAIVAYELTDGFIGLDGFTDGEIRCVVLGFDEVEAEPREGTPDGFCVIAGLILGVVVDSVVLLGEVDVFDP